MHYTFQILFHGTNDIQLNEQYKCLIYIYIYVCTYRWTTPQQKCASTKRRYIVWKREQRGVNGDLIIEQTL